MNSRKSLAERKNPYFCQGVQRAIIDIGSNTVRVVVFGGSLRAPTVLMNEKVTARLGRSVADTGAMDDEAIALAMRALRRYRLLLEDMDIGDVEVVATAAAREASNGPQFLEQVRALGFEPCLLTGSQEAYLSAQGVIGAFPGVTGTVADLGGGSLELIRIGPNGPQNGVTLPLGTLRLAELRGDKPNALRKAAAKLIRKSEPPGACGDPLYLVGGSWRAMAVFAMETQSYPSSDPHGFELSRNEALKLARTIIRAKPEKLAASPRISPMRAELLPDTAVLLQALLKQLQPERIVFSSWGLREGALYDRLDPMVQARDPLLAGIGTFAESRGVPTSLATRMAGWTVFALPEGTRSDERLRLAATMLALASMQIEPNMRLRVGLEWALNKRWIALSPQGRAMIAAAIYANRNQYDLPARVRALADYSALEEAICWGLAIRLCRRIGGRSSTAFGTGSLRARDGILTLYLDEPHADLFGIPNEKDLELLAGRLGLEPRMRVTTPGSGRSEPIRAIV